MNTSNLMNFYRYTIESCITVWYGNCSSHSCKSLQRVVETAHPPTTHHGQQAPCHSGYLPPTIPAEGTQYLEGPQPPSMQSVLPVKPDSETASIIRPSDSSTRAHSDNAPLLHYTIYKAHGANDLLHYSLDQAAILCILWYIIPLCLYLCFR